MNETVNLIEKDNDLIINGIDEVSFKNKWYHYLDLSRDYKEVIKALEGRDEYLDAAIKYGNGIRILNQDLWEIIVTFIISSNNNIPRIKNSIEMLSQKYGSYIKTINGKEYYSFPKAETLSQAKIQDLRACGLGYRDKYILKTSQMIVDGRIDLEAIKKMSLKKGKKELKKLVGVGNKVADCILLFACEKPEAFPVDTWVKKVLADYYDFHEKKQERIYNFVDQHFGQYAGIAQQYLFYYIRNNEN
jgi:N-glycosylase/DNA lyase